MSDESDKWHVLYEQSRPLMLKAMAQVLSPAEEAELRAALAEMKSLDAYLDGRVEILDHREEAAREATEVYEAHCRRKAELDRQLFGETTIAVKRRRPGFWARCWAVLNYPLTSPEFDRRLASPPWPEQSSLWWFIVRLACRLALFSILFWISAPIPMIAGIAAALIIAALHDLAGIWKSKRQSHFLRREEHLRQDGCTEGGA